MDNKYMAKALELAKKGIGNTSPNPLVGAVIVKDHRIIGEGYHQVYGGPHAEVNAFRNAKEDVEGATMYVTLEPCSHYGKTPPCANAIVEKKIAKVVIGMKDPNPLVAGNGIRILEENGIEVVCGVLEEECKRINEIFIKYITTKTPFVIMKTAMTLDGKIAAYTGDSKWITGEDSRKYVHEIRNNLTGIMVGVGTVLKDNPMLTTRIDGGKNPIRIIVDSKCRTPLDAKVLDIDDNSRCIIATTENADSEKIEQLKDKGAIVITTPAKNGRVDLGYLMKQLGEMKIDGILLEGGSELNYSALEEGIVDKILCFIAPKIIGGNNAKTPVGGQGKALVRDAVKLSNININSFKDDVLIEGYIQKEG